jgi:hypothetical protein
VGGKSTWTINQELDNGLMFSKKLLRPSFDDEKNEIGQSLKKKKIGNYNRIEVVNENGENMDGSKVQFGDLGTIINNIRFYKTFIDKNMSHLIVIV